MQMKKNNFDNNIRTTDNEKDLHSESRNSSKKEYSSTNKSIVPQISNKHLEEQTEGENFIK